MEKNLAAVKKKEFYTHGLLFHAAHSINHGFKKVMIHATDTDVVVIAVAI